MTTTTQQYLKEVISALNALPYRHLGGILREQAIKELDQMGLPKSKDEEYRYIPITKLLTTRFKPNQLIQNSVLQYDIADEFIIPNISENRLVLINGKFSKKHSSIDPNIRFSISSLHETDSLTSELVSTHFTKYENRKDPFVLLNTAGWQDGIIVHVPPNTVIRDPLVIYRINDAREETIASHTRLMVVVEPCSTLHIVEKAHSTGDHSVFSTFTEEIVVKENAAFHYDKIQNDCGDTYSLSNTYIHQSKASRVTTHVFTLDGKLVRNNLHITVDGEGCESHLYGLYLIQSKTQVDNHTVVDHKKPHSHSNEFYKGLIDEDASGVFNGKIYVRPQAQQTVAFQSNRNILLSDRATLHAKPQLEIWADDVKCSHGCVSGQLDENALFYLRSRGIPKRTAKAILLYAFAGELLESIDHQGIKNAIDSMLSQRLDN